MDLNWCPCGKQCLEDSLYCSDMCYLKDLASNSNRRNMEKNNFFSTTKATTTTTSSYLKNEDKKDKNYLKVPDFKNTYDNFILSASNNLVFKNRHKYHYGNNHQTKNTYKDSYKYIHNQISSNYIHTINSTIDDYFKKQANNFKVESSPKQKPVTVILPKENENAKEEKNEIKSYSSRSSYIIEAVYPVQNFNKNSIVVY